MNRPLFPVLKMKIQKILSGEAMEKLLTKKSFPQWVRKLKSYKVFAPVKNENNWNYTVVDNPETIDLNYPNTTGSPKRMIFPQREVFLEFGGENKTPISVKANIPQEELSAETHTRLRRTPAHSYGYHTPESKSHDHAKAYAQHI